MTRQPSEIGKYRIERRLGQGGMGTVYLARDSRIGRFVALKLLRVDDDETRMRFEAEAQSAGRLKHANIVTIYDYGDVEGFPFIVMEYVEGATLASMIANDRLPVARRLALIEQVCGALAYAHRAGIIHRDIKPSNLMLDESGVIKLLDFGIARNVERGLTRSGRLLGTAAYMSPEQVRGEPVDRRCDIFSLGVVLYEMLTGQRAFPGDSEYVVYDRILTGTPAPYDHPDPRLTAVIQPILDRALAKQPDDRYQDADSFATDLARARAAVDGLGEDTRVERVISTPLPRFKVGDSRMAPPIEDEASTATPSPDRQVMPSAPSLPAKPIAEATPSPAGDDPSTRERERAERIGAAMARAREHVERSQWDAALRAGSEVLVDDPNYEPAHEIIEEALTRIQQQRRASGVRRATPWQAVEITRAVDPPVDRRRASRPPKPPPVAQKRGRLLLPAAVATLVIVLAGSGYLFRARWTDAGDRIDGGRETVPSPGDSPAPVQPGAVTAPPPAPGGLEKQPQGPRVEPPVVKVQPPASTTKPPGPLRPPPRPGRPAETPTITSEELTIRLADADALFEKGDYDGAITAYEAVLREVPNSQRALLGIRRSQNAKRAEAGILRPGDQLAPRRQEVQDRIASAERRYNNGEYDAAITEYEAVLKISPGNRIAESGIARARKAKQIEEGILKPRRPPPDSTLDLTRTRGSRRLPDRVFSV